LRLPNDRRLDSATLRGSDHDFGSGQAEGDFIVEMRVGRPGGDTNERYL
jgi:hypothetical protein